MDAVRRGNDWVKREVIETSAHLRFADAAISEETDLELGIDSRRPVQVGKVSSHRFYNVVVSVLTANFLRKIVELAAI